MDNQSWINKTHLNDVKKLQREFKFNKPFLHLNLQNFLVEEKIQELNNELKKQKYYLEDHDLYQFERTIDFKNSESNIIQNFRKFLMSENFILFLEEITQSKIQRNQLDLHSLKLTDSHYLLCHDDQVQKRNIAFILNLSQNWGKENAGELELFESKNNLPTNVVKQISPSFNQFSIFKVNSKSFHQIAEVIGEKERISFSGWYY